MNKLLFLLLLTGYVTSAHADLDANVADCKNPTKIQKQTFDAFFGVFKKKYNSDKCHWVI